MIFVYRPKYLTNIKTTLTSFGRLYMVQPMKIICLGYIIIWKVQMGLMTHALGWEGGATKVFSVNTTENTQAVPLCFLFSWCFKSSW